METKTHIVFDNAKTNIKVDDEEESGAFNAVNLASPKAFCASKDNENETIELECYNYEPCRDEINVLEIAFKHGKHTRTKFAVDYIGEDDKKSHIGTYESSGKTSEYEKFLMPEKVKGLKGLVITFKGNDDNSPIFGVKGIRLAKFIEKTL